MSCSLINEAYLGMKLAWGQDISPFSPLQSGPVGSASTPCSILSPSGATASGSELSFPATNAIDGKVDTVWSNLGLGSSITLDLGTEKSVCSIEVSWYKGNERVNTFTISVSDDG